MDKKGLVLEGGGMRGMYTDGILDVFLDQGLSFDGTFMKLGIRDQELRKIPFGGSPKSKSNPKSYRANPTAQPIPNS